MIALIAGSLLALTAVAGAPSVKAGRAPVAAATRGISLASEHKIYGVVENITGPTLLLENRWRKTLIIDISAARASMHVYRGRSIIVYGTTDAAGTVHATAIWRTFPDPAYWPADR